MGEVLSNMEPRYPDPYHTPHLGDQKYLTLKQGRKIEEEW